MTTRVLFISRDRAEKMKPPDRSAIISISDTDEGLANLNSGWHGILRLAFDDLDLDSFPSGSELDYYDEGMAPMTPEQAQETATFIRERAKVCRRIIVHCRYGVSRSAGVAKAVSEFLGLRFPPEYDEYNVYVYRVLKEALASP